MIVESRGIGVVRQHEQVRATDDAQTGVGQEAPQAGHMARQTSAFRRRPGLIAQRPGADLLGRTGHGPGPHIRFQPAHHARHGKGEAQAQSRKPVELTEGPQDDDVRQRQGGDKADVRADIGKSLVNDQPVIGFGRVTGPGRQSFRIDHTAVRIIGINQHQ